MWIFWQIPCLSGNGKCKNITLTTDMEFVQKFTPPDFQAKNFTPSISPNFNSFSGKKHKKWVKMEKFTPLAKNLHCRRQWRHGQIPPLLIIHTIIIHISGSVVHSLTLVPEPERFIRHRCICTRPYRRATLKSRMLYNVLYNLGHDLNQFLS